MQLSAARVLVVRHGESTWNAESRWQGQADPPLSALGERQAEVGARRVAELEPDAVWSSDLVRASRTAELLAPGMTVTLEAALRERDAGEWTGLTRDEIEARDPGALAEWRSPPGFERDPELLARVVPALTAAVGALPEGGVGLAVSHGGVVRTLERALRAHSPAVPNLAGRWVHLADTELGLGLGDRLVLIDPDDVELTVPGQI